MNDDRISKDYILWFTKFLTWKPCAFEKETITFTAVLAGDSSKKRSNFFVLLSALYPSPIFVSKYILNYQVVQSPSWINKYRLECVASFNTPWPPPCTIHDSVIFCSSHLWHFVAAIWLGFLTSFAVVILSEVFVNRLASFNLACPSWALISSRAAPAYFLAKSEL